MQALWLLSLLFQNIASGGMLENMVSGFRKGRACNQWNILNK